MTDQTIHDVTDDDRRRARECAEFIEADMSAWGDGICALARVFLNAVPAPPLPTLSDMTEEERDACKWMQADVANRSVRYVIATPHDDCNEVALIAADGEIGWIFPEYVTPRPDLPRMEWPGAEKDEDANTVRVGNLIESAADTRVAALPTGSILLDRHAEATTKRLRGWTGRGYHPIPSQGCDFGPWTVLHIPKEASQ